MDKYLRPCLAEMVGTFFLCFIGAGAICTNHILSTEGTREGFGLLGIAIAHGLALAIGVSATMNVSGGHLNPAVTFTMWVFHKIDGTQLFYYVVFQLLGSVFAGLLVMAFFGHTGAAIDAHLGAPHPNWSWFVTYPDEWFRPATQIILLEVVLTFLLVFTVFGTAVDPRAPRIGGFGIGLIICADILVGGPLCGACMNPARAFGPMICEVGVVASNGNTDLAKRLLYDLLVYIIGPLAGGVLAGWLYLGYIMPPEPAGHKPDHKPDHK
jgi:aquaporin Z